MEEKEIASQEHPDKVNCAYFSPDCSIIASACSDNIIRIWNVKANF